MAESNLMEFRHEIISGGDEITVVRALTDIPGGRTLNVQKYRASLEKYAKAHPAASLAEAAYAGSPVGRETATGEYLVLPLSDAGEFELPEGVEAVGVLRGSVPLGDARGAIVTRGQVNWAAMPLKVPETVRAALPRIEFLYVAR